MIKLSIIIPVYNEARTISELLGRVRDLPLVHGISREIIIVNDCSTDNSDELITAFIQQHPDDELLYIKQEVNQGKGAALHRGIQAAGSDYIVIQDADLELNPSDINLLLEAQVSGKSQVIYGSRFIGNTHENTKYVWHILGNGFLTKFSNLFSGLKLTDMMTCYKLVPTPLIQSLKLKEKRFGFEPEITLKLSKIKGLTITEVPISYTARSKSDGKKINWKDGMKVIWCILRYRIGN